MLRRGVIAVPFTFLASPYSLLPFFVLRSLSVPRLMLSSPTLTFPPFHPLNLPASLFHPSRHTFILLGSAPLSPTGRDSGALVLLSIWYVPEHHNQSPSAFVAVLIQSPGLTLLPCFFQASRINFPSTQAQGQHPRLVSRSSPFLVHFSVDIKPCRSDRRWPVNIANYPWYIISKILSSTCLSSGSPSWISWYVYALPLPISMSSHGARNLIARLWSLNPTTIRGFIPI